MFSVLELCINCKNNISKKVNVADKNLGTSDELNEFYNETTERQCESSETLTEMNKAASTPIKSDICDSIDILEQKKIAGCIDKMCPMCGKVYSNAISFEIFQDHVESHFIDDTELDLSVEKNFEFVSNTIGQF